jgi:tyrosyl-tRNA synthetase
MPNATAEDVQLASWLSRNAVDSLPAGALAEKLAASRIEARPLRVKLGIDPTAPDIHLGHAVVLGKLREFQDAGHLVVLIVGDFTARVGDPSGRSTLRPILSQEEIEANAETFRSQALTILDGDPKRLEVRRNSEWLDMGMGELLALVRETTVAQLLERDDFAKRFASHEPISLLELLYPLLQGYDSVAVRADVELGGTDQKFNLLLGRDIQRAHGQAEQAILTMPILVGIDGRRKMSKSLGNQIGVTDSPEEMYGRTMKIPDEAMGEFRRLLLGAEPAEDAERPPTAQRSPTEHDRPPTAERPPTEHDRSLTAERPPMELKRELARALVSWLHSPEAAELGEQHFNRVIVGGEAPEELTEAQVRGEDGVVHLPAVIAAEFGLSRSEARRLIDSGGVTLGDRQLEEGEHDVPEEGLDGQILKVGRRRYRRLRIG